MSSTREKNKIATFIDSVGDTIDEHGGGVVFYSPEIGFKFCSHTPKEERDLNPPNWQLCLIGVTLMLSSSPDFCELMVRHVEKSADRITKSSNDNTAKPEVTASSYDGVDRPPPHHSC